VFSLGLVDGRAGDDEAGGVDTQQRTFLEGVETSAAFLGRGKEVSFQ